MPVRYLIFPWKDKYKAYKIEGIVSREIKMKYFLCILLLGSFLFSFASCSSNFSGTIQGIVQGENPDRGSFTLKTGDEKIVEVFVNADTKLDIKNTNVDSIIFEPGLAVQVDLEDQTAKLVEVDLAKVYGIIMRVEYSDLTLQPYGSNQKIELSTKIFSKIIKAGSPLPLNLLTMGRIAEVYFNPVTKTAFQITELPPDFVVGNDEEGSRTGGSIADFKDGKLTINTAGGIPAIISVDKTTKIIRADASVGSSEDLKNGLKVNVEFNPFTSIAMNIEIQN
jgi:hypothetical protein